jgi:hypothetical protein
VAKLVARLLANGSFLVSNPDISQNTEWTTKEVGPTPVARQKNIQKKFYSFSY